MKNVGDYLIPNVISDSDTKGGLKRFGLMRKNYIENHKRGTYSGLVLLSELKKYLLMIQEKVEKKFDLFVEQMAKSEEG